MKKAFLGTILVALAWVIFGSLARPAPAEANVQSLRIWRQDCDASGRVNVHFEWAGADYSAQELWLDGSLVNNDWELGSFANKGPFPAGDWSFVWESMEPDAFHYMRVNQKLQNGAWDPSATFIFVTRQCGTSWDGGTIGNLPLAAETIPVIVVIFPLVTTSASCHPSYAGACLRPSVPDYDCEGSAGSGPLFTGPVYVIGPDVYGLDRDNDGIGCELE